MAKYAVHIVIYQLLIALTLTACATKVPVQNYRLSNNGYATVSSAPHSKLTKQDFEKIETIKKSLASPYKYPLKAYNEVKDEAELLKATLKEKEPDNFTEFRYVWEPEFIPLFSFKREPEKTLAKYTSNPRFTAGKQRHSKSYLDAKLDEIVKVVAPFDALRYGQINMMKGVVEISPGYYEDEFFLIPGAEKFRNDPDVKFAFLKHRPPEKVIDPRVAPHIRLFLRDGYGSEEVVVAAPKGTILLRDGCFFYKEKQALILFPESSNLGLDEEGYIIIYNERGDISRVGEKMRYFAGGIPPVKAKYTKQLQDACGQYPVVKINDPRSEYVARKFDLF